MKTPRQLAADVLLNVYKDKGYSNISLTRALKETKLEKRDVNFVTTLVYGTLERTCFLDSIIKNYIKQKYSKIDVEVKTILRMGFYQLLYMDSVPDNASVNESVKLCPYLKKTSAKGMINAILRAFIRDNKKVSVPDFNKNPKEYCLKEYSCPEWIFDLWNEQYGADTAKELCRSTVLKPQITVRVNTLKTTKEKLTEILNKENTETENIDIIDNCLKIKTGVDLESIKSFKNGEFYPQDISSQICVSLVNPKENDIIIDMCSAPGSKAFTMSQYMNNKGKIYSYDVFEHKIELIKKSAEKLGITIIDAKVQDGTVFNEKQEKADKVLCDVPCSGLGVIMRKPEIKLKNYNEIKDLPEIQYKILNNASNYVKENGTLVYSTCTVNKKENEEVVLEFLKNNKNFKPLDMSDIIKKDNAFYKTFFPHIDNTDGFFVALMKRVK